MRIMALAVVSSLSFTSLAIAAETTGEGEEYWPQWRGPTATGVAPHGNPPVTWSESENIRWKVEIPGLGHATPIVWADSVYVQTAVKTSKKASAEEVAKQPRPAPGRGSSRRTGRSRRGGNRAGTGLPTEIYKFILLAIDRRTGKTVWQRTLCEELPHERLHRDASQASNSPITDGKHIFAYFGSRGLYCLDMHGKVIWEKRLGKMVTRNSFGEGSSPALHGDTIVLAWDHEGQSFIVALDKNTGDQRWKVERDERSSWATPIVVVVGGKPQVVTNATNLIRGYDLATGKLVWQCAGMTTNVIPSPVSGNGLVYAMSGFRGSEVRAIRYADAKGNVADSAAVAWKYDGPGAPYSPSPLLYGDMLYFLDGNRSVLSGFDAKTGKAHYKKKRLGRMTGGYVSPVGASDRVYVLDRGGKMAVIKHGPEFELLATNKLNDRFVASPAIVDGEIYLRGRKYLYCVAQD